MMFSGRIILSCDTMWCWSRMPTFRSNLLPPSSGWSEDHSEDGGSMDLCNVGILPQHYTASRPRI